VKRVNFHDGFFKFSSLIARFCAQQLREGMKHQIEGENKAPKRASLYEKFYYIIVISNSIEPSLYYF
jgi:hypothetical protein